MGLGDFHKHRRLVGLWAIAGVLFYTALIPGHVVSQAAALLFADELGVVAEMMCHDGMMDTRDGAPSAPEKKCPFCKGYAAFMTALAGACDAGAIDAERATLQFAVANDEAIERAALRPHNRGPPLEL